MTHPNRSSNGLQFSLVLLLASAAAQAADPLNVQIDRLIGSEQVGPAAPIASDGEFLRRVYLDLTGTIPSIKATRAFIADKAADKRAKVVDQLLASPRYVKHLANALDVMLMERRADKHVKAPQWQTYLETSIAENKPYNVLAAEMLGADGADEKVRPATKFLLDREMEPNLLTREVSRMFFGRDFECNQCHDHPLIDDYLQSDFYGVYAFLQRSYLFQPDTKKPPVIAEKADGAASFKSVFTDEAGTTRPRLPGGEEIAEPTFAKGEEWKVKADPKNKNLQPIPKYSRREVLARLATNGQNAAFNENIANRLWAHMLGRGLVHPVDLHHTDNPPTHPELLKVLGAEFAAMKFDMKAFLREVALSQTYQRSFQLGDPLEKHAPVAKQQLPAHETRVPQLKTAIDGIKETLAKSSISYEEAKKNVATLPAEIEKANKATTEAQKLFDEMSKVLEPLKSQLTQKQVVAKPLTDASTSTGAASKALPEEKELAGVAAKLSSKAQALNAEVAALTKTVTEKTSAVTAAMTKLDAAKKMSADLIAKLATANSRIQEGGKTIRDIQAKMNTELNTHGSIHQKIETLKAVAAYGDKFASTTVDVMKIAQSRDALAVARKVFETADAELAAGRDQLSAAQTAHKKAVKAIEDANAQLPAKRELAKLVSEASAKTEAAKQQQTDDKEVVAAAAALKKQADKLNAAVAALEKTVTTNEATVKSMTEQMGNAQAVIDKKSIEVADLQPKFLAAQTAFDEANAGNNALDMAYVAATDLLAKRFAMANVQQMSPEQMTWSLLEATGYVDRQRTSSAAEINKKTPLKPEEQKDAAKVAAREREIELHAYNKLKGNVATFVKLFAAAPGQPQGDFFATVDQALFFANGGQLRTWLSPSGENLTGRLIKLEDPRAIAEEMYLSVLTRLPTDEEIKGVEAYLASRPKEKNTVVQEMAWALLTSIEFRFQH